MRFEIYCPCKVDELGTDVITADQFANRVFNLVFYLDVLRTQQGEAVWVYDTRCQFCGLPVQIVGQRSVRELSG